jgi:conjugative relaxase-like TrwC/TraI family protein
MIPANTQIWLVAGVTDMRRGFSSLSSLVQSALDKSPLSGQVFIFRGRRGDLIKLIWHDGDGMCLFQKRLDRGRFVWPQATSGTVSLTRAQLSMLCEGIDWRQPEFARLSEGQNPQTAEQLVRHRKVQEYQPETGKTVAPVEHRAGWDATFIAPKSVSLTALVGGDDRVREAHREAVNVALNEFEKYAQARIGGNRPAETTGQVVVAKFQHDAARPADGYVAPQLHTHAVVFNMTERGNGQIRALQEQGLFDSQRYATAVYQSHLTYRLRSLGYEIEPCKSGAPEIKGFTREYLEASSPRRQQIEEALARRGFSGPEAAQIAAHDTREQKRILSPAEVMAAHQQIAAEFGNQADRVVAAARERGQTHAHDQPAEERQQRAREALTFARDRGFEREAVRDERAIFVDALRQGMGEITYPEVRANFEARVTSGEFHVVTRDKHDTGRLFTTAQTIRADKEIVQKVRDGLSDMLS